MKGRPPRGRLVCPTCGSRHHRERSRMRHRARHGKTYRHRSQWRASLYTMSAAEAAEWYGVKA